MHESVEIPNSSRSSALVVPGSQPSRHRFAFYTSGNPSLLCPPPPPPPPKIWCRYGRDLEHLGRKSEALCAYECGLADPHVTGAQRITLQRGVLKLSVPPRRWKVGCACSYIPLCAPLVHCLARFAKRGVLE